MTAGNSMIFSDGTDFYQSMVTWGFTSTETTKAH